MKPLTIKFWSGVRPKTAYTIIFFLILIQACDSDDDLADKVFTAGTYDNYDTHISFEPANRISGASLIRLDLEGDELRIGLHYYAGAGYSEFSVYTNSDYWEIAMDGNDPRIFSLGDPIYQVVEWQDDLVELSGSDWLYTGHTSSFGPYWDYNEPHYLCFRKRWRGKYHHLWVHLKVDLNRSEPYLEIYDYALRGEGRD